MISKPTGKCRECGRDESNDLLNVCVWKIFDIDCNCWRSDCGMEYCFNDNNPTENRFKYCHGCGKVLKELGT